MSLFSRRQTLCVFSSTALAGFAGCIENIQSLTSDSTTILGYLALNNYDDESSHRFHVQVERDGEVVHKSAHTLDQRADGIAPGVNVNCTWETVPGQYVVSVRVDKGEWTEADLTRRINGSPDCVVTKIIYQNDDFEFNISDQCNGISDLDGGCPAYNLADDNNTTSEK